MKDTQAENEIISHENNMAAQIADFYGRNEQLADASTRRDYFQHLGDEGFIDLLQQDASLVRTGDGSQRQPFDGNRIGLAAVEVPDQADKEQLLKDTWEVANGFLGDTNLSDEDALAYAGLTLAGGILYTHPFKDGNGRSSRLLSYMFINGNNGDIENDLRLLLSEDNDKWQVTPPYRAMSAYTSYPLEEKVDNWPQEIQWGSRADELELSAELSGREDDAVDRLLSSAYQQRALHHFMANIDDKGRKILDKYTTFDDSGRAISLQAEEALRELVSLPEGGIKYAAQLAETQRWAGSDYVHRFLRAMQEDNLGRPANGLGEHLAEIARKENPDVVEEAKLRSFGRYAVNGLVTPRDHYRIQHEANSSLRRRQN